MALNLELGHLVTLILLTQLLGVRYRDHSWLFTWVLEIQTQLLMLKQQGLLHTGPSLRTLLPPLVTSWFDTDRAPAICQLLLSALELGQGATAGSPLSAESLQFNEDKVDAVAEGTMCQPVTGVGRKGGPQLHFHLPWKVGVSLNRG